jgi:hypothetical protein
MTDEVKNEQEVGAFVSSLKRNNKQIRDDRAAAIAEDTELVYKRKIEDIEMEIKKMVAEAGEQWQFGIENGKIDAFLYQLDGGLMLLSYLCQGVPGLDLIQNALRSDSS